MSKFKVGDKVVKADGEKWTSGEKYKFITKINFWREEYLLSNSIGWWDEKELKLYEGVKEMKELTFKEVIANIKEGQIWESDIKIIKCSINGNITVRNKIDNNSQIMNFNKDNLYKLKREEYTFQEAFKAYEEGKEIENIVTKYKFKKSNDGMIKITQRSGNITLTNESSVFVTIDEIRGKWYIND